MPFQARSAALTAFFALCGLLLAAPPVSAATYTFTGDVPVTLTGSGITVSILSGSEADSFTVGSSTILVTVLTGDTFTLRYAGPNPGTLANNGGIPDCTLVGGHNEATVTGPATVTFTPNTTVCGGGGGGGAAASLAENNKPLAVTVASPNGGESVQAGTTRTIFWNKEGGEFHYVTIQLSTNGGDSYPFTLISSGPDNGTFSWAVPSDLPSTTQAKIRVQFIVQGSVKVSDASDANFTIVGAPMAPTPAPTGPTVTGPVPLTGPTPGTPAGTPTPTTATNGQDIDNNGGLDRPTVPLSEDIGLKPPSEPLTGLPKLGETGPAVEALKDFLVANGFPAGGGDTFDAAAQAALVQFQIEHSESGELGPNTLRFINDLLRRSSKACSMSFFGLKPPIRPITRVLARGDAHADVKVLQKFLNDNGFLLAGRGAGSPGAETENFLALTAMSLAKFQAAYGLLSEKGALGPKNLFFLEGLSENPSVFECPTLVPPTAPFARNLKQGDRGADVKVLQKFLNDNNQLLATQQYGSRGAETTYFGPLTRASLKRFQKAYGLGKADGAFDASTRAFINAIPRP